MDLASRLAVSQSRVSQVERGVASLTAEQFITALMLFNATASDFVAIRADPDAELQNALARLGAAHLFETEDVLASERVEQVTDAVREALVRGTPRLLAAVAPVMVANPYGPGLSFVYGRLLEVGTGRRLAWVLENTLAAIDVELKTPLEVRTRRAYLRAQVVLRSVRQHIEDRELSGRPPEPSDFLDRDIRSQRTIDEIEASSSAISKRWGIVTGLQVDDFVKALREARVVGG